MLSPDSQQPEYLLNCLVSRGILSNQFRNLIKLQEEGSPDFVAELACVFFHDASARVEKMEKLLSGPDPDFVELHRVINQFRGSSATFGAGPVTILCDQFSTKCKENDATGCVGVLALIRCELSMLAPLLSLYFQMDSKTKERCSNKSR